VPRFLPPLCAALLAPSFIVKIRGYDVWWHMATGRWILEHGRLPDVDPFTYTMAGKPWHLVNGIADVVLYLAWRLGGETAIVLLKVVFAWLTLTLLGFAMRALGVSRVVMVSLLVLAALLVHGRFTEERPLIMGASLVCAGTFAAIRWDDSDRPLWFFLLALPLWPLVHGNALIGLAQLLLVGGIATVMRAPKKRLVRVWAVIAACLLASVLLPWWRDLYAVSTSLKPSATAMQLTAEWRTGIEALPDRVGHWMVIAGGIAGGISRRRKPLLLLLAIVGAALALQYGRNAYEAVLLAMPGLACALTDLGERFAAGGRLLFARASAPVVAFAVGAIQLALAPIATIGGPLGFGVVRGMFPYDTLETLRQLPVHRLINGFAIGGFLIWEAGPWGVYCDGRTVALYSEEDVKRLFLPLVESAESLTRVADEWNAVYGLTENRSPPQQWMMVSPEWVPLHLGLGTSLFVRKDKLAELPPEVRPLHLVRYTVVTEWVDGWYAGILRDPALWTQLRTELTAAARLGPESPLLVEIVNAVMRLDADKGAELAAIIDAARGGR
jgi:hypothetical protein